MFKCKVCQEKDKRIEELKTQLIYFKKLVDGFTNTSYPRALDLEADKILNGANSFVEHLNKEGEKELSAVERQAIELLTATY